MLCPSKSHGQAPNESTLKEIKYPHGITRPDFSSTRNKDHRDKGNKSKPSLKPKHKGKKDEESLKVGRKGKKPYKKSHAKKSRNHARETEAESSNNDNDDQDDQQSDESSADEDHHAEMVVSFDHISI